MLCAVFFYSRFCIRSLVEGPIYSAIGVVYIHSCNARASYPELCTWLKIRNMRRPDTVSRFSFTIFLSCHGQESTNLRFIRWNMARSFEYKSSQQLEVISTCNLRLDLLTHVIRIPALVSSSPTTEAFPHLRGPPRYLHIHRHHHSKR